MCDHDGFVFVHDTMQLLYISIQLMEELCDELFLTV